MPCLMHRACGNTWLLASQRLKYRYVVLSEPLPRNANGKFLKRELKEVLDPPRQIECAKPAYGGAESEGLTPSRWLRDAAEEYF